MFRKSDYVMHESYGVCQIVDITNDDSDKTFYILKPVNDNLIIKTLAQNKRVLFRKVLNINQINNIIELMPSVEPIWISDAKKRNKKFKELLGTGKFKDLIRIIKSFHLEYKENNPNKKKMTISDKDILTSAKKRLYEEFSFVLNIPSHQVEEYILSHI
jgi:RNA polymerase-interacting CarD/CdnL/TRCF family regulator